ncbi:hypothetical protein [Flavobacterium sp.]|uniref:hypothetical protein n=1 Tax=Flavobacterium sp. TaxID=239 RepID=UPI0031E3ED6B
MKKNYLLLLLSLFLLSCSDDQNDTKVIHQAFTDLVYFDNQFFLTYRESDKHLHGRDGVIKVYNSEDAENWNLMAEFSSAGFDLRDPKFSVREDELELYMHGSKYDGEIITEFRDYRSKFSHSVGWENLENVVLDNLKISTSKIAGNEAWPWRVTWYNKTAYTFGYSLDNKLDLYTSIDGLFFKGSNTSVSKNDFFGNEATIRVNEKGDFYAIIRSQNLLLAKSTDNNKSWQVFDKIRVFAFGGPNFVFYKNKMLITGRDSDLMQVILYSYDLDSQTYKKSYVFPSAGDCGYAGMVIKDVDLWISYYSSHEKKKGSSVYVVKLKLEDLSL